MATIARRNVIVDFEVNSKKAQKGLNDVGKAATGLQSTLQTAAGTFAGLFAFDIAGRLSQGISSAARSTVSLAIAAEQTQVAFETFLGSAGAARKVLEELNQFSELTPFEPEQVIRAGQSLLAFGVEADDLTDTLKALGDISAGTGTDFNELAQIFGKAKVQGRLFGEDINQLTGRGIPIIAEFAKQFGVAESEVKDLVSTGAIGFPQLEKAFQDLTSEGGKFFDLTNKQSQTLAGRISTLTGNFNALLKELGGKLLPVIGTVVDLFGDLVGAARQFVETPISEELEKERIGFNLLVLELQDANLGEERRLQIIRQLQKEYPSYLGNIDAEKVSNEELLPVLDDINKALIDRIALQRQQERQQEAAENLVDLQERQAATLDLVRKRQFLVIEALKLQGESFDANGLSSDELTSSLLTLENQTGAVRAAVGLLRLANEDLTAFTNGASEAEFNLTEETKKLQAQLLSTKPSIDALGGSQSKVTQRVNENTEAVKKNQKALDFAAFSAKEIAEREEKIRLELLRTRGDSEEDLQKRIEKIRRESAERLARLDAFFLEEEIIENELRIEEADTTEKEITRISKEEIAKRQAAQLEAARMILDSTQQLAQATIGALTEVFETRIDLLDKQIDAQQNAVDDAARLAERGSSELLEVEERRLEELTNTRRRAAEQFQVIAQLEVVANQALAVSQGIVAVTSAFATGTLVSGIATSVALAATIASAIFALNNAFSDVPAFAEGTEYFDGKGSAKSDSNIARISRGERIVPTEKNIKYFDTLNEFQNGTPMADYLHGIAQGNIPHVARERQTGGSAMENKQVLKELQGLKKSMDRLDISVKMDKDGFAASITKWANRQNNLRTKLRN